ncbi:MAG: DUF429 domain-containing protein [Chloroflexota bacterium]
MFFTNTTFIGIDPTAGQRPFAYAALDDGLRLLALGQGNMDEVLAFVGGQRQAFACVCAPSSPARSLLERPEIRATLATPPRAGRWAGFRLAEYQLRQHAIPCTPTGTDEAQCPGWMRAGFNLYRRLAALGYAQFPAEGELQWLETYPHAAFCALLGLLPFNKDTFEGRIQRQLVLYEHKLRLPDPMDVFEEITRHRLLQGVLPLKDLYSPAELDALVAAYTAWMSAHHPDQVTTLGHRDEGTIVLPVAELKARYRA